MYFWYSILHWNKDMEYQYFYTYNLYEIFIVVFIGFVLVKLCKIVVDARTLAVYAENARHRIRLWTLSRCRCPHALNSDALTIFPDIPYRHTFHQAIFSIHFYRLCLRQHHRHHCRHCRQQFFSLFSLSSMVMSAMNVVFALAHPVRLWFFQSLPEFFVRPAGNCSVRDASVDLYGKTSGSIRNGRGNRVLRPFDRWHVCWIYPLPTPSRRPIPEVATERKCLVLGNYWIESIWFVLPVGPWPDHRLIENTCCVQSMHSNHSDWDPVPGRWIEKTIVICMDFYITLEMGLRDIENSSDFNVAQGKK